MTNDQDKGFSLIEVLVAVTVIALIASSALGLLGYHRKVAARADERFSFYNQSVALASELPFILNQMDEQFPTLEETEKGRDYDGETDDLMWKARLQRATMAGAPLFFQLLIKVYKEGRKAELVRYLPATSHK